jgi:hypothetical protein
LNLREISHSEPIKKERNKKQDGIREKSKSKRHKRVAILAALRRLSKTLFRVTFDCGVVLLLVVVIFTKTWISFDFGTRYRCRRSSTATNQSWDQTNQKNTCFARKSHVKAPKKEERKSKSAPAGYASFRLPKLRQPKVLADMNVPPPKENETI